jgi:hypothetical protein
VCFGNATELPLLLAAPWSAEQLGGLNMSFARFFRHGARNGVGSSNARKQSVRRSPYHSGVSLPKLSRVRESDGIREKVDEAGKQCQSCEACTAGNGHCKVDLLGVKNKSWTICI